MIGGGIAGMEAAVTAAERGDRVTLVEQEQQLGGQLLLAASPSGRSELARITGYLAGRVREGSVDLRLSTIATPALVTELAPDLVIVATGARQLGSRLGLSGVVTTTWEVLSSSSALAAGGHVVLLDEEGGNGWPFWTAADVLSERGFRVTVVVASTTVAVAIVSSTVSGMLRRLAARGVRIATMTEVQAWENGVVTVRNTMTGEVERWPDVDAVVVDPGRSANNELADTLTEQLTGVAKLVTVGDALAPRRIATAIREARHAVLHEAAVPAGWIPE